MGTTDYGKFAFGGAVYPLTSSTANSLLQDADPAVYYAIDFLKTVLATHLGARIAAELTRTGVSNFSTTVAMAVPFDPVPFLLESQTKFPLLAVHRRTEEADERTTNWYHASEEWQVDYVLPPMSAAQMNYMGPLLKAARDVILDRIENKLDPSYQGGANVWALAGVESIRYARGRYGRWDGPSTNTWFPALSCTLIVKERQMPAPAGTFSPFNGLDAAVDESGPADPPVQDFVDTAVTYVDPTTITGLAGFWTSDKATLNADGYHFASDADQSSGGNAMGIGAAAPTMLQSAFLLPPSNTPIAAVRFDNLSSESIKATVASLAVDTGKTIVFLARAMNTTKRQVLACQTVAADSAGTHTAAIVANANGGAGGLFGLECAGSSFDSTIPVDTRWHVFALRMSNTASAQTIASTVDLHIDGTNALPLTLKSGAGTWSGMNTSNLFAIGANPADSASFAAMDWGVALVFASRLSDSDLSTAMTYCRQWMGVSP